MPLERDEKAIPSKLLNELYSLQGNADCTLKYFHFQNSFPEGKHGDGSIMLSGVSVLHTYCC